MGSAAEEPLDALIVGAGFSGCHILWKLRKLGFKVKCYEWGKDLGGTWWWNRYPGARVDSETPIYQLSEEKEAWMDFEWRERFPGREELMRYFHHIDNKLGLSKDIVYNTFVTSTEWDPAKNLWNIKTDTGLSTWARHLVLCTGFASRRYTPPFKGLDKFKGTMYHSNLWPEEGVDLRGKRVAIVGTGASGVQIIQEIGPDVGHLTVYQRTPNLAIPMRQVFNPSRDPSRLWKFPDKSRYEEIFKQLNKTFGALVIDLDFATKKFKDTTPEERRKLYEYLWEYGGFSFWLCGYIELFYDQEANDEVYAFWAEKTRARIKDQRKKDLLAPKSAPHAWGTKRPCLETSYYEVFNQPNVDIINVKQSPIIEFTEKGIRTAHEGVIPVDVIILATGFDSVTGGIIQININNGKGVSIQDKWHDGTKSYLGLCTSQFPNMYWFYGPQAPTAFSNGPTTGTIQGDWVVELISKMKKENKTKVVATDEAEQEWVDEVKREWYSSLFPPSDSWYQGANIPGKIREPLNYLGGIPKYIDHLTKVKNNGYKGFVFQ